MFKSIKTSVVAFILVGTAVIAHAQKKITGVPLLTDWNIN